MNFFRICFGRTIVRALQMFWRGPSVAPQRTPVCVATELAPSARTLAPVGFASTHLARARALDDLTSALSRRQVVCVAPRRTLFVRPLELVALSLRGQGVPSSAGWRWPATVGQQARGGPGEWRHFPCQRRSNFFGRFRLRTL